MKRHYFILIFVVVFALGCSAVNQIKKEFDKTQQPQVLSDVSGKCQITIPSGWARRENLHKNAIIQASNDFDGLAVIVTSNSKEDYTKEMTLEGMTEITHSSMSNGISEAVSTNPIPTIVNGYPAKQFEISGGVGYTKAKYICTVIETPDNYYHIAVWTYISRFDANKSRLLEIVNSFKETGGKQPASLPPPVNSNKTKSF